MARHRRKTKTHATPSEEERHKIPKSLVLALGEALKNNSVHQLAKDFRIVMQPHTAIKLQERKHNKLKDFIVMTGPLNVSHMLVFSQSEAGNVSLRLSRMPRGPTLTFRVENYSLIKDVRRILKAPKSLSADLKDYLNPPLLVLNGFTAPSKADPYEKLTITLLQLMFPPISPETLKVSGVKRVLILNKNPNGEIDLRHYSIDTRPVGVSKSIKKIINVKQKSHKKLFNLGKMSDISDFVLDPYNGFTSDSEVEDDEIVQVKETPQVKKLQQRARQREEAKQAKAAEEAAAAIGSDDDDNEENNEATLRLKQQERERNVKKKAVKLTEIGPRLTLGLVKIEEECFKGKVLYHSYISKSGKEIHKLEQKHAVRNRLKAERRKEQEANVAAKQEKKQAKKLRRLAREEERKKKIENGEEVSEVESSEDESSTDDEDEDILFSETE